MPEIPKYHQHHHSFGPESSMGGLMPEQQHRDPLHELQDMSDDTEVL